MTTTSPLERVRAYYRDLNTGDKEKVARHFHPDANHFYTRLGPHRGADSIAGTSELGVQHLDASWHLEHGTVVIPKSTNPDRIRSNADVGDLTLSPDDVAALDALGG